MDKMKLVLVTNRNLPLKMPYLQVIRECCTAGIDEVHLREKDLTPRDLYELAWKVLGTTSRYNVPLIIHHDISVALAVGASGVQLGHTSLPLSKARELCPNTPVGVSVHSVKEALEAQKGGAGCVIAGHIFPTACKEGLESRGTGFLKELKKIIKVPITAIGGITPQNIRQICDTGIDGAAVMSSLMISEDPGGYIEQLKQSCRG